MDTDWGRKMFNHKEHRERRERTEKIRGMKRHEFHELARINAAAQKLEPPHVGSYLVNVLWIGGFWVVGVLNGFFQKVIL